MKERVIALGFFDGVHLGHGALLRRAAEEAALRGCTPAVFTFDRPPKEVVTGVPCPLINSPEDRRDLVPSLTITAKLPGSSVARVTSGAAAPPRRPAGRVPPVIRRTVPPFFT